MKISTPRRKVKAKESQGSTEKGCMGGGYYAQLEPFRKCERGSQIVTVLILGIDATSADTFLVEITGRRHTDEVYLNMAAKHGRLCEKEHRDLDTPQTPYNVLLVSTADGAGLACPSRALNAGAGLACPSRALNAGD
ncbi:hypothetical protein PHLCEN_2v4029 [Hermanssonia centrifuga]|uniref:Uncharacterized protein n=1 Tax=Hermanssonia centrifuga TaxID=98765 RepID=A0A2R6Q5H8_9APHY|nr:hypothetical protein PHLCEN_2v4029 [Hermanssonia centrifuga]